jgi:hypothetical protein
VGEDRGLEVAQGRAGVHAELVAQHGAGVVEGAQGVGLASRPVQGQCQMGAQRLAQRVGRDQSRQLAHHRGVPAGGQVRRHPVLDGDQAPLLQAHRQPRREVAIGELDEGRPPPQRLGGPQRLGRLAEA